VPVGSDLDARGVSRLVCQCSYVAF
jgi:hypothetical protein